MKARIVDGEGRDRLVIWLRRRMQEFGITFEALAASIQHDLDHAPQYRDARGNEWNGLGDMPDWLQLAKHAGVSPDFFRIEQRQAPEDATQQRKATVGKPDLQQLDLF